MKKRLITIMVVEDDAKILGQIRWHILRMFNREVQILEAKTSKEAEEIIKQGFTDIAIIDIVLPDGNGEGLIVRIKKEFPHHPIIVQTTIEDRDYQLKIFKEYERIKYLTKETLFEELTKALLWAKREVTAVLSQRIAIPGQKITDSLNVEEICYVTTIPDSHHLHVELYDWKTETYSITEIKNMNLTQFMKLYNTKGYFIRCHNSYIVNRKMIRSASKTDNEILFIYQRKSGHDVRLEIGEKYKKDIFNQLKGLY